MFGSTKKNKKTMKSKVVEDFPMLGFGLYKNLGRTRMLQYGSGVSHANELANVGPLDE